MGGSGSFRGVVALDGPSGTGKSSTARGLARVLGARYLDTGAMYRAATVAVLRSAVDPADADAVAATVGPVAVDISTDPDAPAIALDGVDVSAAIREPATTQAVSAVAAVAAVRRQLIAQQRTLITDALRTQGIVVEGRDITAVVWPQAELKVYLTAREDVRAARRAGQTNTAVADVAADIRRRDTVDSRTTDPLRRADGALEFDTSDLELSEVVTRLADLAGVPAS